MKIVLKTLKFQAYKIKVSIIVKFLSPTLFQWYLEFYLIAFLIFKNFKKQMKHFCKKNDLPMFEILIIFVQTT